LLLRNENLPLGAFDIVFLGVIAWLAPCILCRVASIVRWRMFDNAEQVQKSGPSQKKAQNYILKCVINIIKTLNIYGQCRIPCLKKQTILPLIYGNNRKQQETVFLVVAGTVLRSGDVVQSLESAGLL
jgi:hypothetical protein